MKFRNDFSIRTSIPFTNSNQNLKKKHRRKYLTVEIQISLVNLRWIGLYEMLLQGYNAQFAMPDVLVDKSIKADSVLCY